MDSMDDSPSPPGRAEHACAACQKYKRRCDKALPKCLLCARLQRDCDYSSRKNENDFKARIAELESLVAQYIDSQPSPSTMPSEQGSTPSISEPDFESCLHFQQSFIDGDLRRQYHQQAAMTELVSPTVMSFIGTQADRDLMMSSYFESIHGWMPIISKSRFRRLAAAECLTAPSAEFALCLLAMRLIQHVPNSTLDAIKEPQYKAAKSLSTAMESAGLYSLSKLQADILVAVYEAGHGIFPAAYMSLGRCITQGTALGIHNTKAPSLLELPRTWEAWEERQRVWWMVIILERYIGAASDHRPLFTEDPKGNSFLPVDDNAWDLGESVPPDRLFLCSGELPSSPFACLAHAAHLLGQVIRHCNDQSQAVIDVSRDVETLFKAINSFLDAMGHDPTHYLQYYSAVAVCLSALMKLADQHSCDAFQADENTQSRSDMALARTLTIQCRGTMKDIIMRILSLVEELSMTITSDAITQACLAPWFLNCIYRAAVALSWIGFEATPEEVEKYTKAKMTCITILQLSNNRWKIAGAYIEAIRSAGEDLKTGHY